MTLDEAIKHCEEVAKEQDKLCKRYDDASGYSRSYNEAIRTTDAKRCEECAKEHRQLAEWLKELERYKNVRRILSQNRIATNSYGEVVLWDDIKRVLTEVKSDDAR